LENDAKEEKQQNKAAKRAAKELQEQQNKAAKLERAKEKVAQQAQ